MAYLEELRETAKILGVDVGTEHIDTDDLLAEINKVLPEKLNSCSNEVKFVGELSYVNNSGVFNFKGEGVVLENNYKKMYVWEMYISGQGTSGIFSPGKGGCSYCTTSAVCGFKFMININPATTYTDANISGWEEAAFVSMMEGVKPSIKIFELPFIMPTLA